MSQTEKNIYYSYFHKRSRYTSTESYYDPAQFEWSKLLERNWSVIREEIMLYLNKNNSELQPYFATHMMNKPGKWKVLSFYFWGICPNKKHVAHCPKTVAIIKSIPGMVSASITVLEAHSSIKTHFGDTDAIYRVHLPLVVPASLPETGFQVNDEKRSWEVGKLLIFNDAADHSAWNNAPTERVIFSMDIIRQEYLKDQKSICIKILSTLAAQNILFKMPNFMRTAFSRYILYAFYKPYANIYFLLKKKKTIWYN